MYICNPGKVSLEITDYNLLYHRKSLTNKWLLGNTKLSVKLEYNKAVIWSIDYNVSLEFLGGRLH